MIVACCLLAPVPPHRPKPAEQLVPGYYDMTWSGVACTAVLHHDHSYSCKYGSGTYQGTWRWDAKTRTMHIRETRTGENWDHWSVPLDDRFEGVAKWNGSDVKVTMKRNPKVEVLSVMPSLDN